MSYKFDETSTVASLAQFAPLSRNRKNSLQFLIFYLISVVIQID